MSELQFRPRLGHDPEKTFGDAPPGQDALELLRPMTIPLQLLKAGLLGVDLSDSNEGPVRMF